MAKGTTIRMWKRTLILLIFMVVLGFGAVVVSLVRIQLVQGETLKKAAIDQSLRPTSINAQRGTIYDCTGTKVLAKSASVWTVALEPAHIKDNKTREIIAKGLAKILDLNEADVLKKTKKNTYFTYVKRKVETDTKNEIMEFMKKNNINRGIQLIEDYKRYYPYGRFLAPVLGFTGTDNQGLSGLEAEYDNELRGTAGRLVTAKNAKGTDMPFQYEQKVDAVNGYNLVLTIDEGVQHFLENNIEEGIVNNKVVNGACGVVMNVKTGAILGLAAKGDYDPNHPWKIADSAVASAIQALPKDKQAKATSDALQKQWRNKTVSDTYYPGSVFKMCTGSMGLEEGVISEKTTYTCTGSVRICGETMHCWRHGGHGTETFVQGLCNSCNPFFIQIGQKLGPERFFKYFEAFGFTKKTGIDLPGEARSLYYTVSQLKPVQLATESFGQNFSITPIQMITACSAVANGGYLVRPHIVDHMTNNRGDIVKTANITPRRQVISTDVSRRMTAILNLNATIGTAKNGYIAGYRVCGKTGTSEKVADRRPGESMRYIASYCGFAPADDPQIALLVYFDDPRGDSYYGGSVAGPVFAKTMEQILPYLGVERQYTKEELKKVDSTTPSVVGKTVSEAKNLINHSKLNYRVMGKGKTIIEQIPHFGDAIPQGGTVVLYTDQNSCKNEVTVPVLTGMSLTAANQTATDSGVQMRVTGAALTSKKAVSGTQDIAPGTKVKPGTVVTVAFIEKDTVR